MRFEASESCFGENFQCDPSSVHTNILSIVQQTKSKHPLAKKDLDFDLGLNLQ